MSHWDHEIFSYGCDESGGENAKETQQRLEKIAVVGKEQIQQPKTTANAALKDLKKEFKILETKSSDLRRVERKGELENMDLSFLVQK